MGPGFDCFGMALTLHLEVEARFANQLLITSEGATVPLDRTNLVVKTFLDNLDAGAAEPPLALHLRNRIPLARGLGSSASARVAGLALAHCWRRSTLSVDPDRLLPVACALEGHPDNATPAIYGGFCVGAGGAGFERVEMSNRPYLLIVPNVEIHTEVARQALPAQVPLSDAVFNLQRAALAAVRIARSGDLGRAAPFHDRLHQRHRLALDPSLAEGLRCPDGASQHRDRIPLRLGPHRLRHPSGLRSRPCSGTSGVRASGIAVPDPHRLGRESRR
jgi:homoserine kinase